MKTEKTPKLLKDLGIQFPTPTSKRKARYGLYECSECKAEYRCQIYDANKNNKHKCTSCSLTKHGDSRTRLYKIYKGIKDRCYNKRDTGYYAYGANGITMCDEWKDSYVTFREWANQAGYTDELTIDRIKSTCSYEPDNCRWATRSVQARNTGKQKSNKSGFVGVCFNKARGKWQVGIKINNKNNHLGLFDTALEGAEVRDKYIIDNNLEHTRNFT